MSKKGPSLKDANVDERLKPEIASAPGLTDIYCGYPAEVKGESPIDYQLPPEVRERREYRRRILAEQAAVIQYREQNLEKEADGS